jgi:hypothetical protein
MPIITFSFVLLLFAIRSFTRLQQQKLWHETARIALEKGLPPPPFPATVGRGRMIYVGLVWVAVGIGLRFVQLSGPSRWAPLPICIGIALLVGGVIQLVFPPKKPALPSLTDTL